MKIGILTNEYPPHVYGGAGVSVEYLTDELCKLDQGRHSVKVLCFGEQKGQSKNLSVQGVNPAMDFRTQDPRHRKFLETMLNDLVMAEEMSDVDIVHCHTWYSHLAGMLVKQLLQVPMVLTTHSLEPHRPWKVEQLGTGHAVGQAMPSIPNNHAVLVLCGDAPQSPGVCHCRADAVAWAPSLPWATL